MFCAGEGDTQLKKYLREGTLGKARHLYLYSTFHTRGRLEVLHIETLLVENVREPLV